MIRARRVARIAHGERTARHAMHKPAAMIAFRHHVEAATHCRSPGDTAQPVRGKLASQNLDLRNRCRDGSACMCEDNPRIHATAGGFLTDCSSQMHAGACLRCSWRVSLLRRMRAESVVNRHRIRLRHEPVYLIVWKESRSPIADGNLPIKPSLIEWMPPIHRVFPCCEATVRVAA